MGDLHAKYGDAPGETLALKLLDVNRFVTMDSVKTDASGAFRTKLDLDQPAFLYLFRGERQIASLLLEEGDDVKVKTDTLGAYSTTGSEESLKLQKVENAYNAFMRDLATILRTDPNPDAALSKRYVEYYRDRVSYVFNNSHSLTVVPVFFQEINAGVPVFGMKTDGLLMNSIADSLETVYPKSRYVAALRKEASQRINTLDIAEKLSNAPEIGYLDIDLPGMEGKNVRLTEVEKPVTLIYFWSPTAEQKMFNVSSLLPLYEEFHAKGLEIYAVALEGDKSAWAAVVKNQKLPWVNVCDTRAAASPYIASYGVTSLPMLWVIKDGTLDPDSGITDAASIKTYLKKNLR